MLHYDCYSRQINWMKLVDTIWFRYKRATKSSRLRHFRLNFMTNPRRRIVVQRHHRQYLIFVWSTSLFHFSAAPLMLLLKPALLLLLFSMSAAGLQIAGFFFTGRSSGAATLMLVVGACCRWASIAHSEITPDASATIRDSYSCLWYRWLCSSCWAWCWAFQPRATTASSFVTISIHTVLWYRH